MNITLRASLLRLVEVHRQLYSRWVDRPDISVWWHLVPLMALLSVERPVTMAVLVSVRKAEGGRVSYRLL